MKVWLDTRGIHYPEDSTKVELFRLIKINRSTFQKFSTDSLLVRHGHVACCLPPYHPELNPIEKMWTMVENWAAMKNITSNYKTFENWQKKNSPPSLKKSGCPYVNTYKKWRNE
jgi:hypothetical protein